MTYRFCPQCGTAFSANTLSQKPLRCETKSCGFVFWNNPIPVVAGIVEMAGDVILIQNKGWSKKMFGLITGFLEANETPEAAIVREVKEEIGVDATLETFIGCYAFFQMNQLILAYHLTASGEIMMGEELSAFKRIPIEKLQPWPIATGLAVGDWLAKRK